MNQSDILSQENIGQGLKTTWLGKNIYCFNEIDSTNEEAKRAISKKSLNGSLFIAEQQSHGKGRLGRQWSSPKGVGIWMSILIHSNLKASDLVKSTLLTGLAVCKTLREYTNLNIQIKWPNDIILNGKKICGILVEMSTDTNKLNHLVIGIGINVNTESFPEELSIKASSLKIEGKKAYSRVKIIQEILHNLESYLDEFKKSVSVESFLDDYKKYCITIENDVKIFSENSEIVAKAIDISENGELIIQKQNGEIEKIVSSEVSVRGINGYV